jgi:branched-chain amino acid aminotransferase
VKVAERPIPIEEVIAAGKSGALKEMFASGTAAVISPVGEISYKGKDYKVGGGKTGELARRLYDEITGIQYGRKEDPFGWRVRLA